MPKAYFFIAGFFILVLILIILDRSAYIREIGSGEISSSVMGLPEDDASRKNAVLSAGLINGIIINPGEVFSFNDIVGPRTVDRGFSEGLSILRDGSGQTNYVRDVGGGICRTSTNLHQAVLKAGLEVKERHDHVIPVEYAEKGQDAALLYGKQDYKFRNNRENPVKVVAVVTDEGLRISLEERIQVRLKKHNIFNAGAIYYYRERIKTACKSIF
jgi:vancomycin resistance protein YoaR